MMFPRQHMAWGNGREYSWCKGITSQLPQQCYPACKCRMFRGTKSSWLGSRRLEFQSGIIVPMLCTFASPPYSAVEKGTCWKQCMDVAPGLTQVWDGCQGAFDCLARMKQMLLNLPFYTSLVGAQVSFPYPPKILGSCSHCQIVFPEMTLVS